MSDTKIPLGNTYDFSKNIKNIELNPSLIHGLEQTILLLAIKTLNDASETTKVFAKINKVLQEQSSVDDLNEIESSFLTLFIILNILKNEAKNQNLIIQNNKTIDYNDAKDLMSAYISDDKEKTKEIMDKIKKDLSELDS